MGRKTASEKRKARSWTLLQCVSLAVAGICLLLAVVFLISAICDGSWHDVPLLLIAVLVCVMACLTEAWAAIR